ncbi:heterokaryon incompatibility protein-domain-containing protein [Leptodontidium sp. MPI-SDFR-AT-0119]|nr:heterokaryon incompatibility protein-domain-containing protein [Leptodontidium sp. MPI-SDFR-AT-0119]
MLTFRQRKLPARVIDVLSPALSVDTVCIYEPKDVVAEYIALSHTWGKSPRLRALKTNMQAMLTGIYLGNLPKTFQDAVRITRSLGIRYLWIDCLCIIQDDPQDWEQQGAAMSSVYRHAYLTISASASSDSTSGCFPVRDRHSYTTPAEQSMSHRLPSDISMPQSTMIGTFGSSYDLVASEPLSTRGWTLQERVLSPRTVHYASDQLYFKCESEVWSLNVQQVMLEK